LRPHHPCSIRQPEPERRREPARGQGPARGPEPEQRPEPEQPAGSCPRRTATEPHRPEPEHSTTERPAHKPGRTEPGRPEHSTTERPEHSATHRPERPEHSTTGRPERSTTERPAHSTTCGDGLCSSEPHRPNQRSQTPRPTPPFQTVYHSCEILLWVGNLTRRKHSPPPAFEPTAIRDGRPRETVRPGLSDASLRPVRGERHDTLPKLRHGRSTRQRPSPENLRTAGILRITQVMPPM
jgi:hypothetical protein